MNSSTDTPASIDENISILKNQLESLFIKMGINFAYIAGSFVRGTNGFWSDIDIFVSYPQYLNLSPDERWDFLSKINGETLDLTSYQNIEIQVIEKMPLHIQFSVIKEGIVIFEVDRNQRIEFITNLLPRYYDHKIWLDYYLKLSLEHLMAEES